MLTAFYSLGKVHGAEIWLGGFLLCGLLYVGACLLLRAYRTRQGLRTVLLSLLVCGMVCDAIWYDYFYYPTGAYHNYGVGGTYGLLLWPGLLAVAWGLLAVYAMGLRKKVDGGARREKM